MTKHVISAALATFIFAGCAQVDMGSDRNLGRVPYNEAFRVARGVMAQYFAVAMADQSGGVIQTQPRTVAPGEGALTPAGQRQIATLRLSREGDDVVAYAKVELQQRGVALKRQEALTGGPPSQTPAELEAATTPEQNEYWVTRRRDRGLEGRILADIYSALHPPAAAEQQTQPAAAP